MILRAKNIDRTEEPKGWTNYQNLKKVVYGESPWKMLRSVVKCIVSLERPGRQAAEETNTWLYSLSYLSLVPLIYFSRIRSKRSSPVHLNQLPWPQSRVDNYGGQIQRGKQKIYRTYVHTKPWEYLIFMSPTNILQVLFGYIEQNVYSHRLIIFFFHFWVSIPCQQHESYWEE